MARVNIDILVISELKWIGMGKFNSDDHYVYYCGQESLRRNGIALRLNKRLWNAVLGCNRKNNSMIWFTSKANYSIYSNPSLCPDHWFQRSWSWTVLWRPTRPSTTNTKKRCPFHHSGRQCKSRKSWDIWSTKQVWFWSTKWSRTKANRVLPKEHTVVANTFFQLHKGWLYTWTL